MVICCLHLKAVWPFSDVNKALSSTLFPLFQTILLETVDIVLWDSRSSSAVSEISTYILEARHYTAGQTLKSFHSTLVAPNWNLMTNA